MKRKDSWCVAALFKKSTVSWQFNRIGAHNVLLSPLFPMYDLHIEDSYPKQLLFKWIAQTVMAYCVNRDCYQLMEDMKCLTWGLQKFLPPVSTPSDHIKQMMRYMIVRTFLSETNLFFSLALYTLTSACIFHAVLYTFSKVLKRKICLMIKSFLSHFFHSHDLDVWN